MSVEDEAQALFKKWQAQQDYMSSGKQHNFGNPEMGTDQSPYLFENQTSQRGPDQSPINPINSVRPMGAPIRKAPPQDPNLGMNGMRTTAAPGTAPNNMGLSGVCSECGTIHPPLPKGQKCPNARVAPLKTNDPNAVDDATVNKHIVDMRNIIMTNMSAKGIKNQKKFFQFAIVELTKALEKYNE